jgi:hypothetical protein
MYYRTQMVADCTRISADISLGICENLRFRLVRVIGKAADPPKRQHLADDLRSSAFSSSKKAVKFFYPFNIK